MRHSSTLFLLSFLTSLLLPTLSSCLSEDTYSLSPSHKLTATIDTLHFDTVIAGETSSTRSFWIFNTQKESVRIVKTSLTNGSNSPFSINIDGTPIENGNSNAYFEVRGNDSIRIFAQVTPRTEDQDTAVVLQDQLLLTLESGVTQQVTLFGYSQNVINIEHLIINSDTTLTATRPIRIKGSITVNENTTLHIAPHTTLLFHTDAGMTVHGQLNALGTSEHPIRMRGDRFDYMFEKQPYSHIPGQWKGIHFTSTSFDNKLQYCDLQSGTSGIVCDSSTLTQEKIKIENCIIHNMDSNALTLRHVNAFVGNSQITNAGGDCVYLAGGTYTFVHCTIANFYPFANRRGAALRFTNYDGISPLPLQQADFLNCLITGYTTDEIYAVQAPNTNIPFAYTFRSSLLNTDESTDNANIQACLWDNNKHEVFREGNFTPTFDLDRLIFTFQLDERSQAVNNADLSISTTYYPTDILGRPRTNKGTACMGCYER